MHDFTILGATWADRDRARRNAGIEKTVLRARASGAGKLLLKGKGSDLGSPDVLPLPLPLRAQVHAGNGACWEATFSDAGAANGQSSFKGVSD